MRGRTITTPSTRSTENAAGVVRGTFRAAASAAPVSTDRGAILALFLAVGSIILVMPTRSALAWGAEGHAVVADIAEAHLTEVARRQVRALLDVEGKTNLDQIASWADMVRLQRRDTGPWHYVDIPLAADRYDRARDCGDGQCVVAKIDEFESRHARARRSVEMDRAFRR